MNLWLADCLVRGSFTFISKSSKGGCIGDHTPCSSPLLCLLPRHLRVWLQTPTVAEEFAPHSVFRKVKEKIAFSPVFRDTDMLSICLSSLSVALISLPINFLPQGSIPVSPWAYIWEFAEVPLGSLNWCSGTDSANLWLSLSSLVTPALSSWVWDVGTHWWSSWCLSSRVVLVACWLLTVTTWEQTVQPRVLLGICSSLAWYWVKVFFSSSSSTFF